MDVREQDDGFVFKNEDELCEVRITMASWSCAFIASPSSRAHSPYQEAEN